MWLLNKIQIKDKIVIWTVILLSPTFIFSQFINPPYAGTTSDAHGNVGSMSVGTSYGYLNPAGGFSLYPTVSLGVYTGLYSDWILYYPTIKNISIRFPILINRLCLSASYGTPDDNRLKYAPNRNVFGMGKILNAYYKKEMSVNVAIHPPLKEYFDKLDVYLGARAIRYWRFYASSSTLNDYGYGYIVRTGIFIDYSVFKRNKILLSGVVQPNSIPGFGYSAYPGFYCGGAGIRHMIDIEKGSFVQLSGEVLMPFGSRWNGVKLSAGLSYQLSSIKNRSISLGVFSYPYTLFDAYKPVYWNTIGVTWEFNYFTISTAIMDAINLDMVSDNNSSVGKIFSIGLDIPIKHKSTSRFYFGEKKYPVFYNPRYSQQKINVGTKDSINLFLTNYGSEVLHSATIYSNLMRKDGIIIKDKIINVGDLLPKGTKIIKIPIESLRGYSAQEYVIKSECYYRPDAAVTKLIKIKTIEPLLKISLKMKAYNQLLISQVPGTMRLTVSIHNKGNLKADSLVVMLDTNLVKMGILKNTIHRIPVLLPGHSKDIDIVLELPDTLTLRTLPFFVIVKEKKGYDPIPYYANINLIKRSKIDREIFLTDPFFNGFKTFKKVYLVFDSEFDRFLDFQKRGIYKIQSYDIFPGKLSVGPFSSIEEAYGHYVSMRAQNEDVELFGIKGAQIELLTRYFLAVNNNPQVLAKLKDLGIGAIFQSLQESHIVMIGPFKNMVQIEPMYEFFNNNFQNARVVQYLPNEVREIKQF